VHAVLLLALLLTLVCVIVSPQVRLKRFLEMRGADGGPWRMICALPALWVGLIYEPQAQAEALDLISSWSQDDRDYLRQGEQI
jgi:glutamate--cysteine ligase